VTGSDGIASGLRVLRRVAPPETPWAGEVARDESGRLFVLVDADTAPLGALWDADPAGHLAAPVDLERTATGQLLVLPYCPLPLVAYLAERDDRDRLAPGEAVTLLVSMTRGLRERDAHNAAGGTWWLTDDGMPLLVPGGDDTEDVLTAVGDAAPALRGEIDVVRDRLRAGERLEDREDAMFAVAGPTALVPPRGPDVSAVPGSRPPPGSGPVSRSARPAAAAQATGLGPRRAAREAGSPPRAARWIDSVVDAGVADLVQDASAQVAEAFARVARSLRVVRRPGRRRDGAREAAADGAREAADTDAASRVSRTRRRRLLLVAGIGAALVLTAGLLWPQPDSAPEAVPSIHGSASDGRAPAEPSASPRDSEPAASTPTGTDAAPERTTPADQAAAALLRAYRACAASGCAELREDPSRALAAPIPPGEAATTPVEDFGDVAVVRAEYPTGAVLVVIARDAHRWRLRDAYPVQPPP
jgi:hypothetical protein